MRCRHLLTGLVMGLLCAAALPVSADNGDTMLIGERNSAQKGTILVSARGARTLKLVNHNMDGDNAATALDLVVPAGFPPLSVNSDTKVELLNADLLDGHEASQMLNNWVASSMNLNEVGGGTHAVYGSAPAIHGGALVIGSADFRGMGSDDRVWCDFEYLDPGATEWTQTIHTDRDVTIPGNGFGICMSTGMVNTQDGSANDSHQIRFVVKGVDTAEIQEIALQVIHLPYTG
jgi:hypothetical protein